MQIVKDDNTDKTRLVITLKDNEKVNYKTEKNFVNIYPFDEEDM